MQSKTKYSLLFLLISICSPARSANKILCVQPYLSQLKTEDYRNHVIYEYIKQKIQLDRREYINNPHGSNSTTYRSYLACID